MSARILIVGNHSRGNDAKVIDALSVALDHDGYSVTVARDGVKALRFAQAEQPDLVVLAPMFAWLVGQQVRHSRRPDQPGADEPIIVLNPKTEETLRIMPHLLIRDDIANASFNMDELLIRVRRLHQRNQSSAQTGVLRVGIIEMDFESWTVRVGNKAVPLSSKEFGLLRMLLNAKGRVLTRTAMRTIVWQKDEDIYESSRTVDVHIARLRHKLGAAGRYIVTVRGSGYRFAALPVAPRSVIHLWPPDAGRK